MVIRHDDLSLSAQQRAVDDQISAEMHAWCRQASEAIQSRLDRLTMPVSDGCAELAEAMRYSLLSPGKRVRPMLALLTAAHFDHGQDRLLDFACALELVHCASLILDDLPCMDDARLRRGKPACHLQFGEATASLASVALMNQAFSVLAREQHLPSGTRCALIDQLSAAIGARGLVSGQCRDLLERTDRVGAAQMRSINYQKTGVLFELAVVGAATLIQLESQALAQMRQYARNLGQAFQLADDLLESRLYAEGSGKDSNADRNKSGSVHALGEQAIKQKLSDELNNARSKLPAGLGARANWLHLYAEQLFSRFV